MPDIAAELAAALRPSSRPDAELVAGGGNYVRSGGTWFYAATRQPVPGAVDVTLAQRYAAAPRAVHGDRQYVLLDRSWVDGPQARPELSWCVRFAADVEPDVARDAVPDVTPMRPASTVAVPSAELAARGAVVVGLTAPELDPADLLTASAIAQLLGVTRSTINAYHSRGQMPPPVATLGQRLPLWPRPVIDHWIAGQTRRHRPRE